MAKCKIVFKAVKYIARFFATHRSVKNMSADILLKIIISKCRECLFEKSNGIIFKCTILK